MSALWIAGRLGLKKHARSWRGACPNCGYPSGFSVSEGQAGRPLFWCASCSDADHGAALFRVVRDIMIGDRTSPETTAPDNGAEHLKRTRAAALQLWNRGKSHHPMVERYLSARGLPGLSSSSALRFHLDCSHPEGGRLPAMIARVEDVNGQGVASHRTYLTRDGNGKASVTPDKATLGPVRGGAVRLEPIAPEIVIGEGIESSASAGRLLCLPAWSALSAGNLGLGVMLPPQVEAVVIAADNDPPGLKAAKQASTRWRIEGRRVRVCIPDRAGADFNDLIRAGNADG